MRAQCNRTVIDHTDGVEPETDFDRKIRWLASVYWLKDSTLIAWSTATFLKIFVEKSIIFIWILYFCSLELMDTDTSQSLMRSVNVFKISHFHWFFPPKILPVFLSDWQCSAAVVFALNSAFSPLLPLPFASFRLFFIRLFILNIFDLANFRTRHHLIFVVCIETLIQIIAALHSFTLSM